MSDQTQDPNFTCDNCGADIAPECKAERDEGYMEGHRDAYTSIGNMFREEKFNRTKLQELYNAAEGDTKRALSLMLGIHYVVNY